MTALFRKGDVCTIEVIVTSSLNETTVCVKPVDGYESIYLKPGELTMLRPTFEVGDMVEWKKTYPEVRLTGEVLAISGEHLWIDRGDGNYATVWINNATRVDPEPKASTDPAPIYTTVSTVCDPPNVPGGAAVDLPPSDVEGMV